MKYLHNKCIESDSGITWFEKAEGNPVCSMAHGNSGVMLAYARIQFLDDSVDYYDRIKRIMKYEDQFYEPKYGNWADLRKNNEDRWNTYAWCNAGVGVIAARMKLVDWKLWNNEILSGSRKITQFMQKVSVRNEMCLCHGNIGNYMVLCKIARESTDVWENKKISDLKKMLEIVIRHFEYYLSMKELVQYGIMNGMSGIGVGALLLEKI